MGNLISNDKAPGQPALKLSNGATAVVISVLLLSGSDLASNDWERSLVCWLAEHDQSVYGLGVVGFDLDEIAWRHADFDAQQAFLLRMIDLASLRHRWDALDYDPPFAHEQLRELRALVEQYRAQYIAEPREWNWRVERPSFERCPTHQVYLHPYGCHICNDT